VTSAAAWRRQGGIGSGSGGGGSAKRGGGAQRDGDSAVAAARMLRRWRQRNPFSSLSFPLFWAPKEHPSKK